MVWWPGTKHVNRILTSFFSFSGFFYFWSHPAYNSSIYCCLECNLYNSPIMNLQQIWCLTSDIKMQAIAFENFSKMFLRSILMTPDLLPLATFIKKKKSSRISIRLHSFSKSLEMPLKLKNLLKNEFRKVIKENSLAFSLYKTLKLTLNKFFKSSSFSEFFLSNFSVFFHLLTFYILCSSLIIF